MVFMLPEATDESFVILLLIRVLKRLAAKEMSKLSTNENKKNNENTD